MSLRNSIIPPMLPDQILAESAAFPPIFKRFWNGSGAAIVPAATAFVDIDVSVLTKGFGMSVKAHVASAVARAQVIGVVVDRDPLFHPTTFAGWLTVQVGGIYGDCRSTGTAASGVGLETAVVAGDVLYGSSTTTTRLDRVSATYSVNHRVVALALEAAVSNLGRVLLFPYTGAA